jgi:catechol 2,3-dioxygenase-like lactoylglutathione lyase family enzyme
MPEFNKVVPVLRVTDMPQSVDFYTKILGLQVCWRAASDGGGENCMLWAGPVALLLSTGSHLGDRPQFSGTLYFNMDGVQEFYDRIRERVEVVWPLEMMDYDQLEFGIHDPDGYTLAFAEERMTP